MLWVDAFSTLHTGLNNVKCRFTALAVPKQYSSLKLEQGKGFPYQQVKERPVCLFNSQSVCMLVREVELIRTFLKLNECFDFLTNEPIERSFHQPLSDKPWTHCSRTKVMKCVDLHSVVLSKIDTSVSERKVVSSVKPIGKKWRLFMQWLEKSSLSTQVQGLGSLKSTLTRFHATHNSYSLPRHLKPRALGVVLSSIVKIARRSRTWQWASGHKRSRSEECIWRVLGGWRKLQKNRSLLFPLLLRRKKYFTNPLCLPHWERKTSPRSTALVNRIGLRPFLRACCYPAQVPSSATAVEADFAVRPKAPQYTREVLKRTESLIVLKASPTQALGCAGVAED